MRDEGLAPEEIVRSMESQASRVRTAFVIDTLDYLYMGGRCSAMQHLFGSLLKIRPVIALENGALIVREKIRGSRKKALDSMLVDFDAHLSKVDLHRVFITHTGCQEDVDYLAEELHKRARIDELCVSVAGSTIGSHCGPNTIGILYVVNMNSG
jgi:DegV family protein with EDD domain